MNVHATGIVLGTHGVLIEGTSGSGKSTLSLAMLSMAGHRHAALIGDDQVFLENCNGVLLAHHAPTIAGQIEVFGLGPCSVEYRRSARIDLVIRLGAKQLTPRLQETGHVRIEGIDLPAIDLPERQTQQSALVLMAWLGWPPFER